MVDTTLPPPINPDIASAMALSDQDHQPVVHMSSESSRSIVLNANSFNSTSISISITDTNYNGDGFLSTSSARIPATSNYPLNKDLNANSCSTSLSLNKNKLIGVASYSSILVLYASNKYDLTNFRSFLLTSATSAISNASTTILYNYKGLLKYHMNLVNSKLNGSSVMSPPAFTINKDNKLTLS